MANVSHRHTQTLTQKSPVCAEMGTLRSSKSAANPLYRAPCSASGFNISTSRSVALLSPRDSPAVKPENLRPTHTQPAMAATLCDGKSLWKIIIQRGGGNIFMIECHILVAVAPLFLLKIRPPQIRNWRYQLTENPPKFPTGAACNQKNKISDIRFEYQEFNIRQCSFFEYLKQ